VTDELLAAARKAQERAYAPYSRFRVGAALRAVDGRVFTGVNIENASYPAGICAERSALAAAVSAGVRAFDELAVVGDGDGPCTPCGICRQALYEFAPGLPVIAAGTDGSIARYTLGPDLLPHGFGPERLGG
jgi:cytidine deaminase